MDKVALVTGGARGIGLGISESLANEGWNLVVVGVAEEISIVEKLDKLRAKGVEVLYARCDISSSDDRATMVESIKAKFGRVNLLVNNAGVAPKVRADILEATEESYERVMKINLQGPYFLTQAIANMMVDSKKEDSSFEGCVINISSISSTVASPSRGEYCLSKSGLSMMTKLFAVRLGEFNFPVFEIRPGIIKTDMTSAVQGKYDQLIDDGLCLQSRWGVPSDIGKVVAMMGRGDMGYSTGQVVMIDGGLTVERL